jgi:hypothetical protein
MVQCFQLFSPFPANRISTGGGASTKGESQPDLKVILHLLGEAWPFFEPELTNQGQPQDFKDGKRDGGVDHVLDCLSSKGRT